MEYKKSIIESTLASAKLYYDDRIKSIEASAAAEASMATTTTSAAATATTQAAPQTETSNGGGGSKSQIYSLFGLKRRMSSTSSSKKKGGAKETSSSSSKKSITSTSELKIKEDSDHHHETTTNGESQQQYHQGGGEETDLDTAEQHGTENENELEALVSGEMSASEKASLLAAKIERSVQTLDRVWQELNRQALAYNNLLVNFGNNLQLLQKAFESVQARLNENEAVAAKMNVVNQIESEKLADELEKVKNFQLKISSYQPYMDNLCNHYTNVIQELQNCDSTATAAVQAGSGGEDEDEYNEAAAAEAVGSMIGGKSNGRALANIKAKFEDLNLRWSNLQNQLQENYLHLYSLIESSGADIFIKLADSVQSPWQRAVSANNKIPYYIKYVFSSMLLFLYYFLRD